MAKFGIRLDRRLVDLYERFLPLSTLMREGANPSRSARL